MSWAISAARFRIRKQIRWANGPAAPMKRAPAFIRRQVRRRLQERLDHAFDKCCQRMFTFADNEAAVVWLPRLPRDSPHV